MPTVKVGDKLVEVDDRGIAKCTSKSIDRGNGRVDVEVHIPCLRIINKQGKQPEEGV